MMVLFTIMQSTVYLALVTACLECGVFIESSLMMISTHIDRIKLNVRVTSKSCHQLKKDSGLNVRGQTQEENTREQDVFKFTNPDQKSVPYVDNYFVCYFTINRCLRNDNYLLWIWRSWFVIIQTIAIKMYER